jgi:hypothetical protein
MRLAYAIFIVIARPFLDTAMMRMHTCIVRRLVDIQNGAAFGHVAFNNSAGRWLISVLKYPVAHFVAGATDQTQDRWTVIVIGSLPFCLLARRRGGSVGSRYGVLFFGVLIQLIRFERGSLHQLSGQCVIQIGLDLLSKLAKALAIKIKFSR